MHKSKLAETQREFFGALLKPLRGTSRASTELPLSNEPHDPAFLATADRLLRHSPTLLPAECLELYHRQYWFRILDSLEEDFPGLIRLIGKEAFWEIAENYLLETPSRGFSLRYLGTRLPEYLKKHLHDPVLQRRAVAVAEIECALMAAFEAPDAEPASPERIAGGTRITLHPSVTLLAQHANASDWLRDAHAGWADDDAASHHCAIWRTSDHTILHIAMPAGAFLMLSAIRDDPMSLNDWLIACEDVMPAPETITAWFSQWREDCWLIAATQTREFQ